jgi:hypothetical protein
MEGVLARSLCEQTGAEPPATVEILRSSVPAHAEHLLVIISP